MKRILYIDSLKGLSILCITLLHFEEGIFSAKLNVWIGSFMVYAFFFATGWLRGCLNAPIQIKELLKKRIRQLGYPYLWFSVLIIVFDVIMCIGGFMKYQILFRDIYKTLTFRGIGTLWFLPALFGGEIICVWLLQKKKFLQWLIFSFVVTCIVIYIYELYLPLRETKLLYKIVESPIRTVIAVLRAWPQIMIGYFCGKYCSHFFQQQHKGMIVLIGVCLLISGYILAGVNLLRFGFVEPMLYPLFSIGGFLCLFWSFQTNFISSFLQYWGKNSLLLMVLHYSIFEEICRVIVIDAFRYPVFSGAITLVSFALTVFLIWVITPFFQNYLGFMLGNKKADRRRL